MRAFGHPPVEVGDQVSCPVRHGGFRPLDAEDAVFDALAGDRTGPRRIGQPPQALVQGEPALGEPVVWTGRGRQACGRHQRRREPTAAPFGCRRSGATATARRRRRGTHPARWNNTAVSQRR